jgi:hypothetical protein
MRIHLVIMSCLGALLCGCGENIYDPSNPDHVNPPRNLEGLSWDSTSVSLQWLPAGDVPDSVISGYRIEYNGLVDSVTRLQTAKILRQLPLGRTTFAVLTVLRNGVISDPATFQWAPASRFDTPPVIIYEDPGLTGTRPRGMRVGSKTTSPYAVVLTTQNASQVVQLVLEGSGAQPLRLQSPTYVLQNALQTLFSSTSHASTSLNYHLSSYPTTYDRDDVPIIDDTIYYLRLRGDNGETNYARVHVHITPGAAFPNRSVEVRVSLQRVAELQMARLGSVQEETGTRLPVALLPVQR